LNFAGKYHGQAGGLETGGSSDFDSGEWVCVRVRACVRVIQGDSGGICITLGNDSMSDSKQKSS